MTTAVVLMRCERTAIASAAQALADIDGIDEVYSVSGRYDLVSIVRVRTEDELAELMTGKLIAVEGIIQTETLVAFRAYSGTDLGKGFGLGLEGGSQG
jgi:DNA-binding Lrp family transcriptional regulator